jgi:hypothetical protein
MLLQIDYLEKVQQMILNLTITSWNHYDFAICSSSCILNGYVEKSYMMEDAM